MEQFDSSVEESSKVSEQQQRNDEQQCSIVVIDLKHTILALGAPDRQTNGWTDHYTA